MTGWEAGLPPDVEAIDAAFLGQVRSDVAWVEIDGEVVVYDAARASSYLLNPTGGLIWSALDGTGTLGEIAADLADAFGADPEQVIVDVIAAVVDFAGKGLIEGITETQPGEDSR